MMLLRDICALGKYWAPLVDVVGSEPPGSNPKGDWQLQQSPFTCIVKAGDRVLTIRFPDEMKSPGLCKRITHDVLLAQIYPEYTVECKESAKFHHIKCKTLAEKPNKWPKWTGINIYQNELRVWHYRFNQACKVYNLYTKWTFNFGKTDKDHNLECKAVVVKRQDGQPDEDLFGIEHSKQWALTAYKAANEEYQELMCKKEVAKILVEQLIEVGVMTHPESYVEDQERRRDARRKELASETPEQTAERLKARAESSRTKFSEKLVAKGKTLKGADKPAEKHERSRSNAGAKRTFEGRPTVVGRGWNQKLPPPKPAVSYVPAPQMVNHSGVPMQMQYMPVASSQAHAQQLAPSAGGNTWRTNSFSGNGQNSQPVIVAPQQPIASVAQRMGRPAANPSFLNANTVKNQPESGAQSMEAIKQRHQQRVKALQEEQMKKLQELEKELQADIGRAYDSMKATFS